MRILVVADIHANWPVLHTLQEPHDVCLCLGDLVDYALEPVPCIEWVRKTAHYTVRGNHDHGVAQFVPVNGRGGFKYLTGVTRTLTQQLLGSADRRFLASLPVTQALTLDDTRFFLVHATPRDPLDEYAPSDVDFWTRRLQGVEADVVCVGHTHQPFVLEVDDKLVINPGSLGQPRDGDPRGCYALIEDNRVDLKRVEYPVEDTVRIVQESSLPDQAKEMLAEVYRTGKPIIRGENKKPVEEGAASLDKA
jgi:putative phosphoesterase